MRGGRRLLQGLEQRVHGLLGHGVRVVDDDDPGARFEGQAEDLAHGVANVLDLDRLAGQEPGGHLRHYHDEVGVDPARGAIAGAARVAGLAGALVAEEASRGLDGEGALPHSLRAAQEKRGRQAALAQRAGEQALHAVVAEDARKRHAVR